MSLPRNINALRFTSLLGVLCSMYLCIIVILIFFSSRDIVPDIRENFEQMEAVKFSYEGIVTSVPLIIFAYMYQVNIPQIFDELEVKTER